MKRVLILLALMCAQNAFARTWYPLGGHTRLAPAVASLGSNFVVVMVDDRRRVLYKYTDDEAKQTDYLEVPGHKVAYSAPAAIYDSAGVLRIFVRGIDNCIYENVGLSSVWTCISNFPVTDAVAAANYNGTIYLFARGVDGAIWGKGYAERTWMQMSGPTLGAPAAAAGPAGIELAITGADNGPGVAGPVYHRTIHSVTDAGPWIFLGGQSRSSPGIVVDALGAVRVFTRNLEDRISQSVDNGPLTVFDSAAQTRVSPAASMTIDGKLRLFDVGLDGMPGYQNISPGKLRGVVIKVDVNAASAANLADIDSIMNELGVNSFRLDYLFGGFNAVDFSNPHLAIVDDWVRQQAEKGREPLLVLAGPDAIPMTADAVDRYSAFVVSVMRRFAGSVYRYELFNEPPCCTTEDFYKTMQAFRVSKQLFPTIKAIDPNIEIYGSVTAGVNNGQTDTFLWGGGIPGTGLQYAYGMGIHLYPYLDFAMTPPTAENGFRGLVLQEATAMHAKYGNAPAPDTPPVPLLISEYGFPTYTGLRGYSLTEQANQVARLMLLAEAPSAAFITGMEHYDLWDDGPDPNNHDHNFGLVGRGARKPSFDAVKVINQLRNAYAPIDSAQYDYVVGGVSHPVHMVKFKSSGPNYVYAVWMEDANVSSKVYEITSADPITVGGICTDGVTCAGASVQSIGGDNKSYSISFTDSPIFIYTTRADLSFQ